MNYRDRLKIVEKESQKLGLVPKLDLKMPMTADKVQVFSQFCQNALPHMLIERFGNGDWGQQCLNVASQAFAILQHYKVPCELIYGEVKIGGVNEFETTLSGLKSELSNGYSESGMAIHVWINIGKDYIIDPTISSRIHKYYDSTCPQNIIFSGLANSLKKKNKLEYIPMLAGAKYLELTCDIPLDYQSVEQTA
jgi:hypothetical protein